MLNRKKGNAATEPVGKQNPDSVAVLLPQGGLRVSRLLG